MWQIWTDLQRLVAAWWQIDRLRSPPQQGRLLRITPPALLRIGVQLAEIETRSVGEDAQGPFVVYHGRCGTEACQLWVRPLASYRSSVRWACGARVQEVAEGEVEVFQLSQREEVRCPS